MMRRLSISMILASMLVLMFITTDAQQGRGGGGAGDRDQQMSRDGSYDRDRVQDRDRLPGTNQATLRDQDIYGSALMSAEEMNQYREQFQAQHEKKMQSRAQQQGKDLVPPGQGPIYGGELMTVQERNQYREQLRHMDSEEDREKFLAQHREQMEQRAKALQRDIEEAE